MHVFQYSALLNERLLERSIVSELHIRAHILRNFDNVLVNKRVIIIEEFIQSIALLEQAWCL